MHTSTRTIILAFAATLLSTTSAQSSVSAVSQIGDGQIQAPTGSVYVNPYVTETNSLGVVTGQPLPATSQPSVITSQPAVVTTHAVSPPYQPVGNSTLVPVISGTGSSGNLSTSRTQSASRVGGDESSTASGFIGESTGAASSVHVAGTGLALGLAGSIFAMFL